jgi:transcriptional regulator with XRE-family HTH domain
MDASERTAAVDPLAQARVYVGAQIRAQREAAKMTQHVLATALGVPQPYISSWERGRWMPSIPQLWRICEVLSCSMNDLVGRPGAPAEPVVRGARAPR